MTKIFFLFIFTLSACSSKGPQSPGAKSYLLGRQQNTINQAVSSEVEAEKILRNKMTYFRSLFEQSFDPYYGTPKFDENCLKENVIGEVKKSSQMLSLHMVLALNINLEAGFCMTTASQRNRLSHMIFYHCIGSGVVNRLVVPAKPGEENIDWGELCQ